MTTNYEIIKINRLYNGRASMRDYVWKRLLKNGKGAEFVCKNVSMKVAWKNLIKGELNKNTKFKSKFNDKEYYLVDFVWGKDYEGSN